MHTVNGSRMEFHGEQTDDTSQTFQRSGCELEITNETPSCMIPSNSRGRSTSKAKRCFIGIGAFVRVCHVHRRKFQPLVRLYFPTLSMVPLRRDLFRKRKNIEITFSISFFLSFSLTHSLSWKILRAPKILTINSPSLLALALTLALFSVLS